MNKAGPPQRTWLIAVAAMCVGLIGASMFSLFHYAEWKASVRSTFILQNENTEDAIGVLESRALRSAFSIYFIFLLGLIPFLVSMLRPKPLWISIVSILLLLTPMIWYGSQISHVAWKFVDWEQIYPEWFSDTNETRTISSDDDTKTGTQSGRSRD
ncbi:MAG: hypothetical protein KA250_07535 [Verrucomicrobiales bacterium]|nr:hypothetical protein [Verrucomicrobiales bacterium]MBP9224908.1 hypothetical protein [Verrucomicrobiales bacterium]